MVAGVTTVAFEAFPLTYSPFASSTRSTWYASALSANASGRFVSISRRTALSANARLDSVTTFAPCPPETITRVSWALSGCARAIAAPHAMRRRERRDEEECGMA
jgi:hypothetical protein